MSAWPLAVSIAYPVCIGWLLILLAADGLHYGTLATGTVIPEDVAEAGWMVSSLLLGAAALHSSAGRHSWRKTRRGCPGSDCRS
ncbi:hypothetical protein [Streptomyces sp. NBC_00019]|uniref:hypothetical protein n=1 Tax=Streptomyces sp. NBC_00019 TaxID=2975623 RepID=UPI0032528B6E